VVANILGYKARAASESMTENVANTRTPPGYNCIPNSAE
jgi:hypothetical protein